MSAQPLSDEALREALRLVQRHGSITEAAHAADVPRGTFVHRVQEAHRRKVAPPEPDPEPEPRYGAYDEAWDAVLRYMGARKSRYQGPCERRLDGEWQRVLVLSDIHAPFHEAKYVARALSEDADVLVINGDLSDQYAFSRFTKYERVGFEHELAATTAILEQCSQRYPEVRLIQGNHDARLEKTLRERLDADVVEAILYMTNGVLDPVRAVASRLPNVQIVGHRVENDVAAMWMHQMGDAVICHAEKYSKVPGSALRSLEEWLADQEEALGLDKWRLVIQAHTHQLGWFPWRAGKLLVEQGCLCSAMGYQFAPKVGGRPQRHGYVTFDQRRDGHTDLTSVRPVWLDVEEAATSPA